MKRTNRSTLILLVITIINWFPFIGVWIPFSQNYMIVELMVLYILLLSIPVSILCLIVSWYLFFKKKQKMALVLVFSVLNIALIIPTAILAITFTGA